VHNDIFNLFCENLRDDLSRLCPLFPLFPLFILGFGIGAAGFVAGGVGTLLASKYSPWFQKYMGLSAKASLPVMAGLFMWSLNFELTMTDATRNPEKWGLIEDGEFKMELKKESKLPYHHQAMNYAYDNPFTMIVSMGAPLASTVLYQNLKLKHLTLSQKIMHSRVYAQAGILTIALTTMAFREYMGKRGRFVEPE
jgi:hypothetical protein